MLAQDLNAVECTNQAGHKYTEYIIPQTSLCRQRPSLNASMPGKPLQPKQPSTLSERSTSNVSALATHAPPNPLAVAVTTTPYTTSSELGFSTERIPTPPLPPRSAGSCDIKAQTSPSPPHTSAQSTGNNLENPATFTVVVEAPNSQASPSVSRIPLRRKFAVAGLSNCFKITNCY